jgi:pentatricopeptide repeat protein
MSSVVSALEGGGQWELALQTFKELRAAGVKPNAYCYNATISALAKGAQAGRARDLIIEMRREGYSPDIFTYAPFIEALGRAGLCEEAYVVWQDMHEAGVKANGYVYMALINACEKDNNWPKAVEVFYAMKVRSLTCESHCGNSCTLSSWCGRSWFGVRLKGAALQ